MARSALVLMYHAFSQRSSEDDPWNLFVPPEDLDRQIGFLAKFFRPLDVSGYLQGLRVNRFASRSVLVTIDDGYRSTLEAAAPIFARHRVPAIVFVCPGLFGGETTWMPEMPPEPLMDADEVRQLSEHGIEVGVHGMDHIRLPGLPPAELHRQVADAREAVADVVGTRPRAFAYPEGLFDAAAVDAVRRAGFDVAFSVHEGQGSRFTIPRTGITARDAFPTFVAKTLPGFERMYRATKENRRLRRLAAVVSRQRGASVREIR